MHPYACLLCQEWREAKDQLSFALSVDACIASEVGIAQNPGKKMGVHNLSTHIKSSLPLVSQAPCAVILVSPRLTGGSRGHVWWGCGVCISSSARFCSRAQLALKFCQPPCDLSWAGQHRL